MAVKIDPTPDQLREAAAYLRTLTSVEAALVAGPYKVISQDPASFQEDYAAEHGFEEDQDGKYGMVSEHTDKQFIC